MTTGATTNGIEPRHADVQTICIVILTLLALAAAAAWLRPVIVPFVIAVFINVCLSPLVALLHDRLRLPKPAAVGATLVVGLAIVIAAWAVLVASVVEIRDNIDAYDQRVRTLISDINEQIPLSLVGIDEPVTQTRNAEAGGAGDSDSRSGGLDQLVASAARTVVSQLVNILSDGLLVIVFVIFFLLGSAWPGTTESQTRLDVSHAIRKYILIKTLISLGTGGLHAAVLAAFGVEFALLFGFITFLFNYIPSLGPFISIVAPIPWLMVAADLTPLATAAAIFAPLIINIVGGNLIEPRVMGRGLDLHPVVVLLSLIFFGMIWGIVGMFVATPIVAAIRIAMANNRPTRHLAGVFGGDLRGLLNSIGATPGEPAAGGAETDAGRD
jgi:AI-2 transport protein TqsA